MGVNGAAEGADDRRETAETTAVRAGREANAGRGRGSAVRGKGKGGQRPPGQEVGQLRRH